MKGSGNLVLRLLGSILGITAFGCGGGGGAPLYGAPVPAYGMPYAEYTLSGTVVDSTTNDTISGISLSFDGKTATSGTDGVWSLNVSGFYCDQNCTLTIQDTDGTTNGSYTDTTLALAPTRTAPGSGTMNNGAFEQKDIQVSLDPKP
jgi:putative lipoprotein (rSAM/lipoprotein system)